MAPSRQSDEDVVRDGHALLAFLSEEEAGQFAASQLAQPPEEVRALWQSARSAFDEIPAGRVRAPDFKPLDNDVQHELEAVAGTQLFQEALGGSEPRFVSAEIDPLIAFQQFVDTTFAKGDRDAATMSSLEQIKLCLPRDFTTDLSVAVDSQQMAVSISSLSRNINVSGIEIQSPPGQQLKVAFGIRTRANWIQVVEHEGRFFLKNGYHRAWAFRSAGLTHIPAILTAARSYEETGAGPGFFQPAVVLSDRPPLFKDFFDKALAPKVRLKSTMKVMRFTAQEFVLPRLP